jgi:hypothetical protein
LLPITGEAAVHDTTGTLVVTIGPGQVIVTQLLPALPVCGVQVSTGTDVAVMTLQDVVVQPLARVGASGTQVPEGMLVVCTVQTVVW